MNSQVPLIITVWSYKPEPPPTTMNSLHYSECTVVGGVASVYIFRNIQKVVQMLYTSTMLHYKKLQFCSNNYLKTFPVL